MLYATVYGKSSTGKNFKVHEVKNELNSQIFKLHLPFFLTCYCSKEEIMKMNTKYSAEWRHFWPRDALKCSEIFLHVIFSISLHS